MQCCPNQELCCHALAVHHDSLEASHPCQLLVVRQDGWQPNGYMLISALRGNQQGVAFLIVQDDQSTAPQDFSRAPDQSTWDQRISVDRLTMAINRKGGRRVLSSLCIFLPP
jgi:hypothetical protein